MNEAMLTGVQNALFEAMKRIVLEAGQTPAVGFLITTKGMEQNLENGPFTLQPLRNVSDALASTQYSIVIVNMEPDDDEVLSTIAKDNKPLMEYLQQAILVGIEAMEMPIGEVYNRLLSSLLRKIGKSKKDIVLERVRMMCNDTKAFAFISNSMGYTINVNDVSERDKFADDLADDERSQEIIFSLMECHGFRRHVGAVVHREPPKPGAKRDSGKIRSLEEQPEIISRDNEISGPLASILIPVN